MQQRPFLQIVDQNFRIPRSRRFAAPEAKTTQRKPSLLCLPGGSPTEWRSLRVQERKVRMQIMFNRETGEYTAAAFHGQELLEIWTRTESSKKDISMWFDRKVHDELGLPTRVPWEKIKQGQLWESEIVLTDLFFQQREDRMRTELIRKENAKLLIERLAMN